jgi:hypothetical protein
MYGQERPVVSTSKNVVVCICRDFEGTATSLDITGWIQNRLIANQ